jgi:hypothetical protein
MHADLIALERLRDLGFVRQVRLDDSQARRMLKGTELWRRPYERSHLVALRQQLTQDVETDVAGGAGQEDAHTSPRARSSPFDGTFGICGLRKVEACMGRHDFREVGSIVRDERKRWIVVGQSERNPFDATT